MALFRTVKKEGIFEMDNYEHYNSPYSWRYGSIEMRKLWSEKNKRLLWRRIWVEMADIQRNYGLVTEEQFLDLKKHMMDIDIKRSLEIEQRIHHDLVSEINVFAERCPKGGAIIHLGATSVDIKDNATALQIKESLEIISKRLEGVLGSLADLIEKYAGLTVIGFTHLQPAEPTTLGYRLSIYAQDLLEDYKKIQKIKKTYKGKGFKGAVGTGASFMDLLGEIQYAEFEQKLSEKLDLSFYQITNQTYPRRQEYEILSVLAGIGVPLNKFAYDIRLLQSPMIGEIMEGFTKNQVGSSAMPFKRNPINSEKLNSLARLLAQFPRVAWDNAATTLLERTLDDSANRRSIMPEAFLITDELLITWRNILDGLVIDEQSITRNLENYSVFASVERVLMELVKAGLDRRVAHETLRKYSMGAWNAIGSGKQNPLVDNVSSDPTFLEYVSRDRLQSLFSVSKYVGFAEERAKWMASEIRKVI